MNLLTRVLSIGFALLAIFLFLWNGYWKVDNFSPIFLMALAAFLAVWAKKGK